MTNATPLKLVLEKTYWEDLLLIKRHYERELNWAHFILGLIVILIGYAYRGSIYHGILETIQVAETLVNHITHIKW